MENLSLKWSAPEYQYYKRSNDWFWAVGIITVSITTLAFIFGNALFGIFIILAAFILIFYTIRIPNDVEYEINNRGISINKLSHPYLTIEAFWVETRQGEPKIILKSKKTMMPYIIIPLHEESIDTVNDVLRNYLEEKEMQELVSHKVMEYLGF